MYAGQCVWGGDQVSVYAGQCVWGGDQVSVRGEETRSVCVGRRPGQCVGGRDQVSVWGEETRSVSVVRGEETRSVCMGRRPGQCVCRSVCGGKEEKGVNSEPTSLKKFPCRILTTGMMLV